MADRRAALLELGALLGLSDGGRQQLALGFDRPEELLARFRERFSARGIEEPIPDLPWIRLVDALRDERRCAEIDWKASADDIESAWRPVIKVERALQRVLERNKEEPTDALLGVLGDHFAPEGKALCSIDYGADAYALVLVPAETAVRAQALAADAGYGSIRVWRGPAHEERRSPDGRDAPLLHDIFSWDDQGFSALRALPDGRAVVLDANELRVLTPGEPQPRRELLDELLPSEGRRAAFGQLALFRSGAGFGALSNRRVRLWPAGADGDAVTLAIDGELPQDEFGRRPAPATGGVSDRPDSAIVIFHRASRLDSAPYLGELRLDAPAGRASWRRLAADGHLPQIRRDSLPLPEVARLVPHLYPSPQIQAARLAGDDVLVCVTAPGDPDHPHLARVDADGSATAQLSIDEAARAQLTSCGQYLLVAFGTPRRTPRQGLWSLKDRSWVAPVNLVEKMGDREILDHDGDVWWLRHGRKAIACEAKAR